MVRTIASIEKPTILGFKNKISFSSEQVESSPIPDSEQEDPEKIQEWIQDLDNIHNSVTNLSVAESAVSTKSMMVSTNVVIDMDEEIQRSNFAGCFGCCFSFFRQNQVVVAQDNTLSFTITRDFQT